MKLPKDDPLILAFLRVVRGFPPDGRGYLACFDDADPGCDGENIRENLVVPALVVMGYPAESMARQQPAEGEGAELLVRGPAGQPFLIACVRDPQGRRLPLYRPYFLNSQFRKSGAVLGILTDGDGLEVWERRAGLVLKLAEVRLTGALKCMEQGGGPEAVPDEMWRGLERVAYLERALQWPLRFGEAPPAPRDASLLECGPAFLADLARITHLVRWDIRARHGGALGRLSKHLSDPDVVGESAPPPPGDMPSRILGCFRPWAEGRSASNPVTLVKPYLEELVQFTCARLFVMRYYEEKGLLGRPEGLAREGAPGGILYQYERMRRVYPDFFGSGPFDWYLPDELTTRAIRLCLDRHRVAGLAAWEAYDLVCAGEKRSKGEILSWLASEAASHVAPAPGEAGGSEPLEEHGRRVFVVDGGDGLTILAAAHGLLGAPGWGGGPDGSEGSATGMAADPRGIEALAQDPGSAAFATLGYLVWAADAAAQPSGRISPPAQPLRVEPLRLRVLSREGREGRGRDEAAGTAVELLLADLSGERALRSALDWMGEISRVRPGGLVAILADSGTAAKVHPPAIASLVAEGCSGLRIVNFGGLEEAEPPGARLVAILYRQGGEPRGREGAEAAGAAPTWPHVVPARPAPAEGAGQAEVIRDFRSVQDLVFGSFASVRVPEEAVLDRAASRLKLDYHPRREGVLAGLARGAVPLRSIARVFRGVDAARLGEDRGGAADEGDPGESMGAGEAGQGGPASRFVKRVVVAGELGRYRIEGTGRRWKAARPDGSPQALIESLPAGALGRKILVRVDARRLVAAMDDEGVVPAEPIHGLVPISMQTEEARALLALLNSEMATLVFRAWSGVPAEAGDVIDLERFLDWFPVRPLPPGRPAEVARLVDAIHFFHDTIRKRRAKLASFAELAREAWVSFVSLKEAKGLFVSWKLPPVAKGLEPIVREGRTVTAGEELSFSCRGEPTARYLEVLLGRMARELEGVTGVEIEGRLKLPRTEPEIGLLLRQADLVREGIDSFARQVEEHERRIDRILLDAYGLAEVDLEALREA